MVTFEALLNLLKVDNTYERYVSAMCPFDDHKTAALLVFKDGWFRCLSCGRHGTWKTLWNKLNGQPVQIMPERSSVWGKPNIPNEKLEDICYQAHMDLIHFPSLGWYLEMRGVDSRIESNELGYWEGWYTIPVRNKDGDFVTAVLRAAPHVQTATGLRYWNHHVPVMFAPDWNLMDKSNYVIVVFGMLDALYLSSLRYPVVTSSSGKDSFKAEWLDDYRKTVYIIPDLGEELLIHREGNRTEVGTGTPYRLAAGLGWRGSVLLLDYPEGVKDVNGFHDVGKADELIAQLSEL